MLQIATSSARAAWRVAARPSQAVRASHHRKLFDVPRGGVSLQHRTAGAATASAASVAATGRAAFGLGLVAAGGFGAATTFALAEPSDGSSSAVSLLGTYGLLRDGTYGVRSRAQDLPVLAADADTRVISLEEVREHTTEESLWVVYDGVVYDVTGFLKEHPGGMEAILGAGGQDLGAYWAKYQIHFQTAKAMETLANYRIGRLSEEDAARAVDPADPANAGFIAVAERADADAKGTAPASVGRAQWRNVTNGLKVVAVGAAVPLWFVARVALRAIGILGHYLGGRRLADLIAHWLPVSVYGFNGHAPLPSVRPDGTRTRVAVIGGGISGVGCAYTLRKSGFDVVIYEARDKLGGNAQTATFDVGGGRKVTQDLSVLFWAPEYYKNYGCLMKELGIAPAEVAASYLLHTNDNPERRSEYYTPPGSDAHGKVCSPSLQKRFAKDFERYDRLVAFAKTVNTAFTWDSSPSFYKHTGLWSYVNPLNFIPVKTCAKLFGISDAFYSTVLNPFHGWNFSTANIDTLPTVALPVLDDIVPLTRSRQHLSWGVGNSHAVFDAAARDCEVRLDTRVRQVHFDSKQGGKQQQQGGVGEGEKAVVVDDRGGVEEFDRVVFACPATAVSNALKGASWCERWLLRGVYYQDDFGRQDWGDWLEVPVHQDATIFPPEHRETIMKEIAFIVDVDVEEGGGSEYNVCLGSWSPSAAAAGAHGAPMFMTQCVHPKREIDPSKVVSSFSAPRAHPALCFRNMMLTQLMPYVQGRRGVYFCSNWVTAGNGHDLSLLAGIACATAVGADYPFPEDDGARLDHERLSGFMFGRYGV